MMRDAFLLLATCSIGANGFALMAFSQKQHWSLLRLSSPARPPVWLRPTGWILLGLAAVPALVRDGLAFGLLLWTTLLTFSALLVIGFIVKLSKRGSKSDMRSDYDPTYGRNDLT